MGCKEKAPTDQYLDIKQIKAVERTAAATRVKEKKVLTPP